MKIARQEREELCALLREVGPDAPTLCDGWTSRDLAAHLWQRETDPVGAPGIIVKPLADVTEKRRVELAARYSYAELVDKLQAGPASWSLFALPGVDESANAIEYFVHHEDVRRAGPHPASPRTLSDDTEAWFWRRLKLMARVFYRRSPVGVILHQRHGNDTIRAMSGTPIVTIIGAPSELMLYTYGRKEVADVTFVGDEAALAALADLEMSL